MAAASTVVAELKYASRCEYDTIEDTLKRMTLEERDFVFTALQALGLLTHIVDATQPDGSSTVPGFRVDWEVYITAFERAIKG